MSVWERNIARPLRALHLDTIRNKIIAFALLATLVPTLATTLASYGRQRELLAGQTARELSTVSSEAAREIALWLDRRRYDLHISAGAYVIAENLARLQGREAGQALGRIRTYLNSVRERFPDHEALFVLDARGRTVATTSGRTGTMRIPPDPLRDLQTGDLFLGDAYWDATLGNATIVLAVPVRQPDGRFVAALGAKTSLTGVGEILQQLTPREPRDVYVITEEGRLVIRSRVSSSNLMRTRLPDTTMTRLLDREGEVTTYGRSDGGQAVGVVRRVPQLGWAVVADIPRAEALREAGRLRNNTILMSVALLGGLGLVAYMLGLLIVRPLGRLTGAAARLAAGDLTVELPHGDTGEVGALTQAFRTLAGRLRERESQGELEKLSVTDALTGLYNRRHLTGTLANEVQRSRRLRRTFSVLLADVDHFKQYNDTHGHLEGDAALVKIAEVLRKTTRGVDSVARYGGEEFLVMLLETTLATAITVAERIRARVEAEAFGGGRITVSVGVAEYPTHGDTPEELIASADAAMYAAKGAGRNRVVAAAGGPDAASGPELVKPRRRKGEI